MAVGLTRRALLAASAAAAGSLATGCRGIQVLGSPPALAPDIRLLRTLIAAEQVIVARYRAAVAQAGPGTAGPSSQAITAALTTILDEHEQHLARLRNRLVEPASYRPPAMGSRAAALPAGTDELLTALAGDEQAASGRFGAAALAVPPPQAQLLASIAASEATHIPALNALRRQR